MCIFSVPCELATWQQNNETWSCCQPRILQSYRISVFCWQTKRERIFAGECMIKVLVLQCKIVAYVALKLFRFRSVCNNATSQGLNQSLNGFEPMWHVFVWMNVEGLLFQINKKLSNNMTQFIFSLVQSFIWKFSD